MKKDQEKKSNLSVIRGDLPVSPGLAGGDFIRAEVTDTRLMGVIGVHIERKNESGTFHQLFYLDMEEYGLDEYKSYTLRENAPVLKSQMDTMFGSLGATWHEINEKEAIYLIQEAVKINEAFESEFPDGFKEYESILNVPSPLTDAEIGQLWSKTTVKLKSDYELINYYIMRHAAMDQPAENYLSAGGNLSAGDYPAGDLPLGAAPEPGAFKTFVMTEPGTFKTFVMTEPGTLYRNEVQPLDEAQNSIASIRKYLTRSIVSDDTGFRYIISSIDVAGPKVISFTVKHDMRISGWEAANIMARKEYVTVIKALSRDYPTLIPALRGRFSAMETHSHNKGKLLMFFKKNNNHVNKEIYRLDEDVRGSIFIDYKGELVLASYDLEELYYFESVIREICMNKKITLNDMGRFAFPEATLGHYVNEDYGEFSGFLDFIQFLTNKE